MKKLVVVTGLAVLLAALAVVGVFAQGSTPPANGADCPMGGQMAWGRGMMMGWAGLPDAAVELLGLSEEEIQAERLAGKSLAEIAGAQGVDVDALAAAFMSEHKAALDALVKDGKLTQAQADLMYDHMDDMIPDMLERGSTGPAWQGEAGARGMRGGMGMRGRSWGGEQAPMLQRGGTRLQTF